MGSISLIADVIKRFDMLLGCPEANVYKTDTIRSTEVLIQGWKVVVTVMRSRNLSCSGQCGGKSRCAEFPFSVNGKASHVSKS